MNAPESYALQPGELYVFGDASEPDQLWGIYDTTDPAGHLVLEAASADFKEFRLRVIVPPTYTCIRPASRSELRDFAYNMGWAHI